MSVSEKSKVSECVLGCDYYTHLHRPKEESRLTNLMNRDKQTLANLEVIDNGKPMNEALFDVHYSIETLKYYAGWTDKFFGETIPLTNFVSMTKKEPIGVVGQIIPWNYPLLMLAWKWGPALATGCTIIMKPAEQTPLSALHMAALSKEAGFPNGVINIITGYGPTAGAAIALHNDIQKVAFTGSVEVGRIVMQSAAKSNLKKVSLELGGKSPVIVFDDVDVNYAVDVAHEALFANHGHLWCVVSSWCQCQTVK